MARRRFIVTMANDPFPAVEAVIAGVPDGSGAGVASLAQCKREVIYLLKKRIDEAYVLINQVDKLRVSDIPEAT